MEVSSLYSKDKANDDECIETLSASSRGYHTAYSDSLIDDKDFCLAARAFVRKHACTKGKPNLMGKMFAN